MTSDERAAHSALATGYAVCWFSIVSSLAFFVSGVAPLPVLLYFPLGRRFAFHSPGAELSMDYYGRSLLALLCGGAVGLIVYLLASPGLSTTGASPRSKDREPADPSDAPHADRATLSEPSVAEPVRSAAHPAARLQATDRLQLFAAYCLTAALLAAGMFAYQLMARIPIPESLPTAAHGPRI